METKTVIIIGRSPFITPELLEKIKVYPAVKVAINHSLPWFDYIVHVDNLNIDYGNAIPITCMAFHWINTPEKYEMHHNPKYVYDERKNALRMHGFTHDVAVSWAIHKGFEKIILAGAADFIENGKHYDDEFIFNPRPDRTLNSINYINSFDNVYTLNPDSKLSVKRILL